jgi:hypothetical protein
MPRRKKEAPAHSIQIDEQLYAAWLIFVFDRPVTPAGWYFDLEDKAFAATNSEIVALIEATMIRCGADLSAFNDEQIYYGLQYIFNTACSDVVQAFADGAVPTERKSAAIRAITTLYQDIFAPRCDPVLGHLSEKSHSRLNAACYMLWDTTALTSIAEGNAPLCAAIAEVMACALRSSNIACVESGLHGLGHFENKCPALVTPIVEAYLRSLDEAEKQACTNKHRGKRPTSPRSELKHYALAARKGAVL